MKRLLLIAALVAPTWLYSCMPKTVVPTPASVIEQAHEAFPTPKMPDAPFLLPSAPSVKPIKKPVAKRQLIRKAPVPRPMPTEEPLPPQEGVICIFPLNMVPACTPEPAGRMP